MSRPFHIYRGNCYCGLQRVEFQTLVEPAEWNVRACQCHFCQSHSARTTSDPLGVLQLELNEQEIFRYRFGLATADFLLCKVCRLYLGALLTHEENRFMTVNVSVFNLEVQKTLPPARSVQYTEESARERITRRMAQWTPVQN